MKRFIVLCVLLITVITMPPQAYAQGPADKIKRSLSVSGQSQVRVVPDQVLLSMTAEARGTDLLKTQQENDKGVKSLIEYTTQKLGIKAQHIQTDFTSIEPVYRQCNYDDETEGRCSPLDKVYYSVRKGVQIRLSDLSKYEDLVTKSLELGITRIEDVQFITTELRKHRDKARELAAIAAKEKADSIAKTMGVQVKKPITINVEHASSFYGHHFYGSRGRGGNAMMQNVVQVAPSNSSSGNPEGMALGQINVSATIHAVYEIE